MISIEDFFNNLYFAFYFSFFIIFEWNNIFNMADMYFGGFMQYIFIFSPLIYIMKKSFFMLLEMVKLIYNKISFA